MKNTHEFFDPPKILVIGFSVLIIIGAILLTLPLSTVDGIGLSFLDALFTSTSPTSVTGLFVCGGYLVQPLLNLVNWSYYH